MNVSSHKSLREIAPTRRSPSLRLELPLVSEICLALLLVLDEGSYSSVERQQYLKGDIRVSRSFIDLGKVLEPKQPSHLAQAQIDVLKLLALELQRLPLHFQAEKLSLRHTAYDAVVSVVSMADCEAGIMVVTADEQNKSSEAYSINMNILIEIGTAFVLYDQGVILIWDKRLKVPSNLQGLYRLEFEGAELSFATGTKLAKAVKGLRRPEA